MPRNRPVIIAAPAVSQYATVIAAILNAFLGANLIKQALNRERYGFLGGVGHGNLSLISSNLA